MMQFEDKISIVVPFRNVEPYIDECLKSIKNQTYDNFEVIMLDDDSNDGSEIIAEEYSKKDSRFLYYKLPKQRSIGALRNLGLQLATGKYLAWVDSDDIVSKDFLKILYLTITSGNYQMAVCSYIKTKNRKVHLHKFSKNLHLKSYTALEAQKICLSSNKIGGFLPLKLFITELAKKVKFDDNLKACEDLAYAVEYLDYCQNICRTPKKLYLYFVRKGSLSHSYKLGKMLNFVKGMNYLLKCTKDKPYYDYVICWRAMMCCMPIFLSIKDMRKPNAKKMKMLFAKYFEIAQKTIKAHNNKIGLYSRFVIALFNVHYYRYIKRANKLLKNTY